MKLEVSSCTRQEWVNYICGSCYLVVLKSSSGMISVGHLTVSRHDEVSTSSLNDDKGDNGENGVMFADVDLLIVGGLS